MRTSRRRGLEQAQRNTLNQPLDSIDPFGNELVGFFDERLDWHEFGDGAPLAADFLLLVQKQQVFFNGPRTFGGRGG